MHSRPASLLEVIQNSGRSFVEGDPSHAKMTNWLSGAVTHASSLLRSRNVLLRSGRVFGKREVSVLDHAALPQA
jgi:hypothetical protein